MADNTPRVSDAEVAAWLDELDAEDRRLKMLATASAGALPSLTERLNAGTDAAVEQARVAQTGPFGLVAAAGRGLHNAGRRTGDYLEAAHGSRAGADPITKGAEGQAAWAEAEELLRAARQAKAQALMQQLFLGPLARKGN